MRDIFALTDLNHDVIVNDLSEAWTIEKQALRCCSYRGVLRRIRKILCLSTMVDFARRECVVVVCAQRRRGKSPVKLGKSLAVEDMTSKRALEG